MQVGSCVSKRRAHLSANERLERLYIHSARPLPYYNPRFPAPSIIQHFARHRR